MNWDIFLWVLQQVAERAPVVGETPLTHEICRTRLLALSERAALPFVEVFLDGDRGVLLDRVLRRAAGPASHPIKTHFTVDGARGILATPYDPLLPTEALRVDTTDITHLDVTALASQVCERLA